MLWTRGTARTAAFRRLRGAYSIHGVRVSPDTETQRHAPLASHDTSTTEARIASGAPGQDRGHVTTNVVVIRSHLQDWGALACSSLRQRVDQFSKKATTTFSHLGLHLNRVTGYEEIEALKRQVSEQETRIKAARKAAREAKTGYDDAVLQRSISQRQVNDLLQRKSSWTDTDVSNFTSLVRSDHSFEQEESRAKARVAETEDAVEREFSELMKTILARYHEEQVWSDKIRSASTYGSLAVLGVNLVVFIMAIIVVEPWKRKRLAQTFEKKVEEMGVETKVLMDANATRVDERLTGHEKLLTDLIDQVSLESRHQGAMAVDGVSPEKTPAFSSPPPSGWSQVSYTSYPLLGAIRGRELMLVAGSAAAGAFVTLLTRSIFVK